MAGKTAGARRRDMYLVTDAKAFGEWVRLVAEEAGGVSALARMSGGRLRRQGLHEWIAWADGGEPRREVWHVAVEALAMSEGNREAVTWDAAFWWTSRSIRRCLMPPHAPRPMVRMQSPRLLSDGAVVPFAPLWAHHPDAFGKVGVSRLMRGLYPFTGKEPGSQWPTLQWVAVDAPLLAQLERGYTPRMLRRDAKDAPLGFAGAAAFVAWRWAKHPPEAPKRAARR